MREPSSRTVGSGREANEHDSTRYPGRSLPSRHDLRILVRIVKGREAGESRSTTGALGPVPPRMIRSEARTLRPRATNHHRPQATTHLRGATPPPRHTAATARQPPPARQLPPPAPAAATRQLHRRREPGPTTRLHRRDRVATRRRPARGRNPAAAGSNRSGGSGRNPAGAGNSRAPDPAWGGVDGRPGGYLAGWWRRVGATVIDGILVGIVGCHHPRDRRGRTPEPAASCEILIQAIYLIVMLGGNGGRTVGNLAVRTRTINARTGAPMPLRPGRAADAGRARPRRDHHRRHSGHPLAAVGQPEPDPPRQGGRNGRAARRHLARRPRLLDPAAGRRKRVETRPASLFCCGETGPFDLY